MKSRLCAAFLAAMAVTLSAAGYAQANAGEVSFANSGAPSAQAPFLLGLALLHDFEYASAARQFKQAEAIDPNFAMAYWGEAMTFNHPVWNQQNRRAAMAVLDRLGTTEEQRLAKAPTEREKDYLRTLDALYGDGTKPERDQHYADAYAKLHAKYPDDVEASAFYALALLGTGEGVRNERIYMQAAGILMPLFYKYPNHPGIAHYLIHACDDPMHASLALPAARAYSKIAPDAAHAQHMTSHIFLALGMWNDVVQANEAATRVANEQRTAAGRPSARCGHYNYWLEYGYLETGSIEQAKKVVAGCREEATQAGVAAQAGNVTDPDNASMLSFIEMQTRYLIDTAKWGDYVPGWTVDPGNNPMAKFGVAYAVGFSSAEKGDVVAARKSLADMDALLPRLPEVFDQSGASPDEPDRLVPAIERQQVQAVILSHEGKLDEAVALAQTAAKAEMNLPFAFGPPSPLKPSYELLAELLLQQNRPREAEEACRQALLRAPNRTQSQALLERASAAVGPSNAKTPGSQSRRN